MMTKKDFERIAQVMRVNKPDKYLNCADNPAYGTWEEVMDDLCVELKAINPRFDGAKFRKACHGV